MPVSVHCIQMDGWNGCKNELLSDSNIKNQTATILLTTEYVKLNSIKLIFSLVETICMNNDKYTIL